MWTVGPSYWTGGEQGDPFWSFVRTLLHFDGNTTDSSTSALPYANSGGAVIASTGQRFGSGCLDCTASVNAVCSGGGVALALGTSNFCIECWFYDPSSAGIDALWSLEGSTSRIARVYSPGFGGNLTVDVGSGGGPVGTTAYSYTTWNHSAVTRNGSNWTHWLNGVAAQTWTNSTADFGGGITQLWIGNATGSTSGLRVLIDDFRVTIGNARYTAPFTPSGPFPDRGV